MINTIRQPAGAREIDREATPARASQHPHRAERNRSTTRLSTRLWGLDWSEHLPWRLDDVTVESGTTEQALGFMRDHYPTVFEQSGEKPRFLIEPMSTAKQQFCREMDVFTFRCGSDTIGILMAHPSDWSSYY